MTILFLLIPVSLVLGFVTLGVFYWTLKRGQYGDLSGDSMRILTDEDSPLSVSARVHKEGF
jgi:cbb3-type cytochrome oxidase maturation protein